MCCNINKLTYLQENVVSVIPQNLPISLILPTSDCLLPLHYLHRILAPKWFAFQFFF